MAEEEIIVEDETAELTDLETQLTELDETEYSDDTLSDDTLYTN